MFIIGTKCDGRLLGSVLRVFLFIGGSVSVLFLLPTPLPLIGRNGQCLGARACEHAGLLQLL